MDNDVQMTVSVSITRRLSLMKDSKLCAQDDDQAQRDDWVQIKSSDGYSFIVQRDIAEVSGTLKNMLSADSRYYTIFY